MMRVEFENMDSQAERLLAPAPLLWSGSTVTLAEAEALGLDSLQLLRVVAAGKVLLHCRMGPTLGHLVELDSLPNDPYTRGKEIPAPKFMPTDAVEISQAGLFPLTDSREIANALLVDGVDGDVEIVAVQATAGRWFVPTKTLRVPVKALEVSAKVMKTIRDHLASRISPAQIEHKTSGAASSHESGMSTGSPVGGSKAKELFSTAVQKYCSDPDGLPQKLASAREIRQRKNFLLMFAEFMGDFPINRITPDDLRQFRDVHLRAVPAKANNLPKSLKRDSMPETIKAIKESGTEWPLLSLDARQERMAHLLRMFAWLQAKRWIDVNPASPLQGESGVSKSELKEEKRRQSKVPGKDEGRGPFTDGELLLIFGTPQYATGDGRHVTMGNQTWSPFEYWLPVLALYTGCRIGELCQLHLSDVRQEQGIWVLDLNESTPDKRLKNDGTSVRLVPLHSGLIELGFLSYCDRLRSEGFRRVFPELTYAETDARYAKEPIRKMSRMLADLGMPRNAGKVFHCFRHNANDALLRADVPKLGSVDVRLRTFIRHKIMGHQLAPDVNSRHYTSCTVDEMAELMKGVSYTLPPITSFNIEAGLQAVRRALDRKKDNRRGKEDLGPP